MLQVRRRSAERDGAGLARWMGWADVDARESARSGPPCDRPNARARQPSVNHCRTGRRRHEPGTRRRRRGRSHPVSCSTAARDTTQRAADGREVARARRRGIMCRAVHKKGATMAGKCARGTPLPATATDEGGGSAGCGREQRQMRARATDAGRRATRAWETRRAPPSS